MRATNLEFVEEKLGWDFAEYDVVGTNKVYADGARSKVLRIGGPSLHHEASVLPYVPDGVPHAEVIDHGELDDGQNLSWIINSYVPGSDARQAWEKMSLESKGKLLSDARSALSTLHTSVDPAAESVWANTTYRPPHWGEGRFDGLDPNNFRRRVDIVRKIGLWTEGQANGILSRYDELRRDSELPDATNGSGFHVSEAENATYIHGDTHLGNYILSPGDGSLRGLIDFETAGRGLPEIDYYRTLNSIDRYDPTLLDSSEGSAIVEHFIGGVDEQNLSLISLLNLVYHVRQVRDNVTAWRKGVPDVVARQLDMETQGNGIRERVESAHSRLTS